MTTQFLTISIAFAIISHQSLDKDLPPALALVLTHWCVPPTSGRVRGKSEADILVPVN